MTSPETRSQISESNSDEVYLAYLSEGRNIKDPDFVSYPEIDLTHEALPVKVISFYLPQYHPIPENDQWWGRGFTEWANVSKAAPNFVDHYQPHLPGELGFYDLRVPEVQRRQVELAKKFGIYGFCFYHYWFNGKRLLELPLDQFASDKEINFPFCLCWANENWTRRWDGLADDILIAQNHSVESDIAFITDIESYLKHNNYIRINGLPVLMVYRPQLLPDPAQTAARWKQYCLDHGVGNLYLIAVQSSDFTDPRPIGFDAAVEFPPHGIPPIPSITDEVKITNPGFKGMIYDYQTVAEAIQKKIRPDFTLFNTVIPAWDNTARRQDQPLIFHHATPEKYQVWLTNSIQNTLQNCAQDKNIVFINAWNEWAEGTHLEPDRKYGYAFLLATANAIKTAQGEKVSLLKGNLSDSLLKDFKKRHDTAVILHIYYPELWGEIAAHLENLNRQYDLFVSIPDDVKIADEMILKQKPDARIYRCKNRGRDIAPFLELFGAIEKLDYKYYCKIHTKKTIHRENGDQWRVEILDELLGSGSKIKAIKEHLDARDIGIIGPRGQLISTEYFMGGNEELVSELAKQLNLKYENEFFPFIAGSMFWFKSAALRPVLGLSLKSAAFPVEHGQKDATLAHALERMFCLIARSCGYKVIETGTFSETLASDFPYAVPLQREP